MHCRPHEDEDGMKVWLDEGEVELLLRNPESKIKQIAFGLGARCGLRSEEVSLVAPGDVVDGPAGPMLVLRDGKTKGDKYRETPIPSDLQTTIETAAQFRDEADESPIVTSQSKQHQGVSTRTLRRWMQKSREELAEETGDDRWEYLSFHDLRRTWATQLANDNEVDPLLVCDWGGWTDLETFLDHYRGAFTPQAMRREREKVSWL